MHSPRRNFAHARARLPRRPGSFCAATHRDRTRSKIRPYFTHFTFIGGESGLYASREQSAEGTGNHVQVRLTARRRYNSCETPVCSVGVSRLTSCAFRTCTSVARFASFAYSKCVAHLINSVSGVPNKVSVDRCIEVREQ